MGSRPQKETRLSPAGAVASGESRDQPQLRYAPVCHAERPPPLIWSQKESWWLSGAKMSAPNFTFVSFEHFLSPSHFDFALPEVKSIHAAQAQLELQAATLLVARIVARIARLVHVAA